MVASSMKMLTQCATAVRKANSMQGIIREEIDNKSADTQSHVIDEVTMTALGLHPMFSVTRWKL